MVSYQIVLFFVLIQAAFVTASAKSCPLTSDCKICIAASCKFGYEFGRTVTTTCMDRHDQSKELFFAYRPTQCMDLFVSSTTLASEKSVTADVMTTVSPPPTSSTPTSRPTLQYTTSRPGNKSLPTVAPTWESVMDESKPMSTEILTSVTSKSNATNRRELENQLTDAGLTYLPNLLKAEVTVPFAAGFIVCFILMAICCCVGLCVRAAVRRQVLQDVEVPKIKTMKQRTDHVEISLGTNPIGAGATGEHVKEQETIV